MREKIPYTGFFLGKNFEKMLNLVWVFEKYETLAIRFGGSFCCVNGTESSVTPNVKGFTKEKLRLFKSLQLSENPLARVCTVTTCMKTYEKLLLSV